MKQKTERKCHDNKFDVNEMVSSLNYIWYYLKQLEVKLISISKSFLKSPGAATITQRMSKKRGEGYYLQEL